MTKLTRKTKALLALSLSAVLVASVSILALQYLLQPAQGDPDPSDQALSASIIFRDTSFLGNTIIGVPFSFAGHNANGAIPFSIVDNAGRDIDESNMLVSIQGNIITGGEPLAKWEFLDGEMAVLVDGAEFVRFRLEGQGTGTPTAPVALTMDGGRYKELTIPVSLLQEEWGKQNFGNHTISVIAKGKIKGTFVNPQIPADVKDVFLQEIGKTVVRQETEATIAIELISSIGSSGITTTPQNTTYTWSGSRTGVRDLTSFSQVVGQKMTDFNSKNVLIVAAKFQAFKAANVTAAGDMHACVRNAVDSTIIGCSVNQISRASVAAEYKYYTFAFPAGLRTPSNADHVITLECMNCDGAKVQIATNKSNPWPYGNAWYKVNTGVVSEPAGFDLLGSVTYKNG